MRQVFMKSKESGASMLEYALLSFFVGILIIMFISVIKNCEEGESCPAKEASKKYNREQRTLNCTSKCNNLQQLETFKYCMETCDREDTKKNTWNKRD